MKKKLSGYSIQEADKLLNVYIDESAERLRKRLKTAWKKQSTVKIIAHEKATA